MNTIQDTKIEFNKGIEWLKTSQTEVKPELKKVGSEGSMPQVEEAGVGGGCGNTLIEAIGGALG